jgi:hypothetical protein
MGRWNSEVFTGEAWDEDRIGMNVLRPDQPWDAGGPVVLMSDWWVRAHWGRAFEILDVAPNIHGQSWALSEGATSSSRSATCGDRGRSPRVRGASPQPASAPARPGGGARRSAQPSAPRIRGVPQLAVDPPASGRIGGSALAVAATLSLGASVGTDLGQCSSTPPRELGWKVARPPLGPDGP